TVYEGEVAGLALAAEIAQTLPPTVRKVYFLLDNQAAVRAVRKRKCRSGQLLVDAFHRELSKLNRARRRLDIHIAWVPGHCDVRGNELADEHAKRAAQGDDTGTAVRTLANPLPRSAAATRAAYKHAVAAQ
ncbi:hypothetical protein EXIGLDRAFT_596359, partial [Exidia glandulosa HHB12029]